MRPIKINVGATNKTNSRPERGRAAVEAQAVAACQCWPVLMAMSALQRPR